MAIYQIHKELDLAVTIEEAWGFISSPSNLVKITPEQMAFEIVTAGLPEKIYPGLMIEYRVSPLKGIRMPWLTEITHVNEQEYFVDEQRKGPYALWHHEHRLIPAGNAVHMEDLVTYQLPAGPLGTLVHGIFVKKRLEAIFDYREEALVKMFGRP